MSEEAPHTLFNSLPKGEDLGGLFTLYTEPDGSTRAEFGSKTEPLAHRLAWKLDESESSLAWALALLTVFPEMKTITDPEFLKLPLAMLKESMGADLEILTNTETSAAEKKKARSALKKRFETTLDTLEKKSARPPHGSAATLAVVLPSGQSRLEPLALVALKVARQLVEATRTLPTKGDVQEAVESRFSEAKDFERGTWSKAFKEAGLDDLRERGKFQTRPSINKERQNAREQAREKRAAKRDKQAPEKKSATRAKRKP